MAAKTTVWAWQVVVHGHKRIVVWIWPWFSRIISPIAEQHRFLAALLPVAQSLFDDNLGSIFSMADKPQPTSLIP
ncbi:hypothetical protein [Gibbsiella quercinecans]|uniref:hypothetical protein n=1 Tax=Gibbsiella quercinecans TaxID=929813 RepID=UPI00243065E2|nr:hypothetical protein [Gibbsiella quercinecans]